MTNGEIKAAQFNTLMNQVNSLYTLDGKVYVDTLEGTELGTVTEINPSKFTVSCSVVLDLGNGRQQTLMFTASDIEQSKTETPQPVDTYQDLELTEDVPTSEEINEALGVKEVCSFMEAVEANTAETKDFIPLKERKYTEAQKHAYWDAYHEGYNQAQSELNHIVNP